MTGVDGVISTVDEGIKGKETANVHEFNQRVLSEGGTTGVRVSNCCPCMTWVGGGIVGIDEISEGKFAKGGLQM